MTESEAIKELQDNMDLPFGVTVSDEASRMALNALEKQIPKKPINYDKHYYKCSCCNEDLEIDDDMLFIYDEEPPKFCIKCGQKLDWGE